MLSAKALLGSFIDSAGCAEVNHCSKPTLLALDQEPLPFSFVSHGFGPTTRKLGHFEWNTQFLVKSLL